MLANEAVEHEVNAATYRELLREALAVAHRAVVEREALARRLREALDELRRERDAHAHLRSHILSGGAGRAA